MKDTSHLRRELVQVNNGIADLLKALQVKRPMSATNVKGVLEDLLVHAGGALFQLDCLEGGVQLAAKDYHPGT